jgi:hypothetical protein
MEKDLTGAERVLFSAEYQFNINTLGLAIEEAREKWIEYSVDRQVIGPLRREMSSQVWGNLEKQLRSQVSSRVDSRVYRRVYRQVWDRVYSQTTGDK